MKYLVWAIVWLALAIVSAIVDNRDMFIAGLVLSNVWLVGGSVVKDLRADEVPRMVDSDSK